MLGLGISRLYKRSNGEPKAIPLRARQACTMIRRFGEPVEIGRRYKSRPGAYAILFDGSDILLTFQDAPIPELQLPGGGIDLGESDLSALHREVLEETGWGISNPVRLGAYRRFAFMPEYDLWAEKIAKIYLARPTFRKSDLLEAGHTAVWMTPHDAAKELSNAGDRHFLKQAFGLFD